ncbi:hypothetical protein ACM44_14665 [Chryseobacterium koreense CCUG 49689]|uniref:Uncharacterized protein n=1 Tax=Chryseobacterium koreense CCUG 49689 TaxID=1304281 RepID=A0A0J7IR18_9FLAO|nr:hypothetical protein ACM44_14665 [Chryseobacterium koreense CCUG 49689]
MFIIYPCIYYITAVITDAFINFKWTFLKDIIIWPILGTLMWIAQLFELKYIIFILFFGITFLLLTFYLKKTRNFYFIFSYLISLYIILFGKEIYYFLLNQNNTIHKDQITVSLISIIISSFIFYRLLRKYIWK